MIAHLKPRRLKRINGRLYRARLVRRYNGQDEYKWVPVTSRERR